MSDSISRADILALRLLLSQRLYGPHFDICSLKFEHNIVFNSIQNFCENSRATLTDMEIDGRLPDGYTVRCGNGGNFTYVVLYNSDVKSSGRRRFTLAHEIGHIYLEHIDDSAKHEIEADRFAAQFLLPRVLVWELLKRSGFCVSAKELAGIFGVSQAAARNRLISLDKANPPVFSEDELKLLNKFGGLLPQFNGPLVDC